MNRIQRLRRRLRLAWAVAGGDALYQCPVCRTWFAESETKRWRGHPAVRDAITGKRRAVCPGCKLT